MTFALSVLAILGFCAYFVAVVILRGWALSVLWGWFVVPFFHLPPLSIPQAIGISMVAAFLTYQYRYSKENDDNWHKGMTFGVIYPLLSLAIGYVVKGYL